jgi:hypothetical protein
VDKRGTLGRSVLDSQIRVEKRCRNRNFINCLGNFGYIISVLFGIIPNYVILILIKCKEAIRFWKEKYTSLIGIMFA